MRNFRLRNSTFFHFITDSEFGEHVGAIAVFSFKKLKWFLLNYLLKHGLGRQTGLPVIIERII